MAKVTFDETTHTYCIDGVPVPSVTQIIKPLYNYGMVSPDVLRRKGEFGTAVHKAVELYLYGTLDEETLVPELLGCLQAFKRWCADYSREFDIESALVELAVAHEKLQYAGRLDFVFDGQAVIDLKSRDYEPRIDPVQLVAYEQAYIAGGGSKGKYVNYVLSLYPDETYQFCKAMNPQAWGVFRKCLDHWKHEQEFNYFVKAWRAK